MIIRKGKNLRHYHICQGEGWISAEGRFTELPSSEIIIFLPYFQGVPHLRADDSRYWLSVFRKPVNEPCREFTNCGGFSKHKPENSGLCLTVSIAYSYEGFMCLGVSVIVRVHCISRTPWCLSTCYHKTSLPLWLILLGWWHSSQYTISRTLLPLFMPLFFFWKALYCSLRHQWSITVGLVVPFTPCPAVLISCLQTQVEVWWLWVSRGRGLSWAWGPYMEEWVQGRDIWQQEVDPVNEALASGPDKGIHSSWFGVSRCVS